MKTISFSICVLLLAVNFGAAQDSSGWDSSNAIRPERARIDIRDQVELSADVPGKIVEMSPSDRGGVVTKGEVVIRLDAQLVEAQLAEADAKATSDVLINYALQSVAAAKHKLKSKRDANAEGKGDVFSPDEIRQFELEVTKAEAELEKAREDKHFAALAAATKRTELQQYTIRAESSGLVTDTHRRAVGSAVRQGDPIMTVVDLTRVHLVVTVSPEYESRINIGDTVLVRKVTGSFGRTSPARPAATTTSLSGAAPETQTGETFVGKISYIGSSNPDAHNLMELWAVVTNKLAGEQKWMLREGSRVEARILSPEVGR